MYDTPSIQEDSVQKLQTLKNVALFIVLSPYDNEQSDLIHHILKEKNLKEIPKYKSLLEQFINQVRRYAQTSRGKYFSLCAHKCGGIVLINDLFREEFLKYNEAIQ